MASVLASHPFRGHQIGGAVDIEEEPRGLAEPGQLALTDSAHDRQVIDERRHAKIAARQLLFDEGKTTRRIRGAERLQAARKLGHRGENRRRQARRDKAEQLAVHEWHVPRDHQRVVASCRLQCRLEADETAMCVATVLRDSGIRQPLVRTGRVRDEHDLFHGAAQCVRNPIDDTASANRPQTFRFAAKARVRATGDDRADQTRSPLNSAASSRPAVSARSTRSACVGAPRRSFR